MASKSLGTLTLDLIAKIGGFEQGLDKAGRKAKSTSDSIARGMNIASKAIIGLGLAGATATAALIKSSINNADQLSKTAQITGVAIEDLSALSYAAELGDVAFEELTTGLVKFSKAIDEAVAGSGTGKDAFDALKISIRDSNGVLKPTNELLNELADRFASMEDGAVKTAMAQDLLGRAGARMIPFLNGGREGIAAMREEAELFGRVIDEETGARAEAFNDNLTRMKSVITGTGNELAASLLPEMVEFTDLINDPQNQQSIKNFVTGIAEFGLFAVKAGAWIAEMTGELAEWFAVLNHGVAYGDLPRLQEELDETISLIEKFKAMPGFDSPTSNYKSIVAVLEVERENLEALIDLTKDLKGDKQPGFVGPTQPSTAEPFVPDYNAGDQEDLLKAYETRLAKYREEVALQGEVTELDRIRYEFLEGALKGISEEQQIQLENLAMQIDAMEDAQEAAEALAKYEALVEGLERQVALYGDITEVAKLRYEFESGSLTELDELQQGRLIALADELDALNALAAAEEARLKKVEQDGKWLEEIGLEAARNIHNSLADFLFDPFDKGLKGMVKGFANTMRELAAQALSQQILKTLFGGFAGSTNSFLAAVGGAFGGAKDTGGSLQAGQWGIAGEIGPEIVHGPATVIGRNHSANMLGSGVNITVINNTPATVRQETRFDGGRRSIEFVIDAVKQGWREGALDDVTGGSRVKGAT